MRDVSDDVTLKALYDELQAEFGNGGRIPPAAEISRVQDLASYGQNIEALKLNYQNAVLVAGSFTEAHNSSIVVGGWQSYADREDRAHLLKANFYDVYGANKPFAVANAQLHQGKGVPVYIEDQPLVSSPPCTPFTHGPRRRYLKRRLATRKQNAVSHVA